MSEHAEIQKLLVLAASGVLDAGEQRRVDEHLRSCAECTAERDVWSALSVAIREVPAPELPEGLVARTTDRLRREQATRSERRWSDAIMAFLLLLGWTVSLLLWFVWRMVTGGGLVVVGLSLDSPVVWVGATTVLAWLTAGAAAAVLAFRPASMRRTL